MNTAENHPTQPQPEKRSSPLLEKIALAWPAPLRGSAPIVVGVSGGPDSVALLRLLIDLRTYSPFTNPIIVTHFNHALRGPQSDQDERFVVQLAQRLGVPCKHFRSPAGPDHSSENSLRNQRYSYFEKVARESGARYVFTAHHRDDQIETLLFRLFRGTSLRGLTGLPRVRSLAEGVSLIRPLLTCSRGELQTYLRAIGQDFRNDDSNRSSCYSRNFIRNELLPLIESRFGPEVGTRLLHFRDDALQTWELRQRHSQANLQKIIVSSSDDRAELSVKHAPKLSFDSLKSALVFLWESQGWSRGEMTRVHWETLARFILDVHPGPPPAMQLPGSVDVRRSSDGTNIIITVARPAT